MTLQVPKPKSIELSPVGSASIGQRFVGNAELNELEKQNREAQEEQNNAPAEPLAIHIWEAWERNRNHKQNKGIEQDLIDDLRRVVGDYSPEEFTQLEQQGSSTVFMPVTAKKKRGFVSWVEDIIGGVGDKSWSIDPTPVAELPEEDVQAIINFTMQKFFQDKAAAGLPPQVDGQQDIVNLVQLASDLRDEQINNLAKDAEEKAKRMETQIHDDLVEGNFKEAFNQFLEDVGTFRNGFIKGPIVRKESKMNWVKVKGRTKPKVTQQIVEDYERVSPFDVFPSPDATTPQEGDFIERMRFTRKILSGLRDDPSYKKDAIDLALEKYGKVGYRFQVNVDPTRAQIELKEDPNSGPDATNDNIIEALQYNGSAPEHMLASWGVEEDQLTGDLNKEHEIVAIMINHIIIKATLNEDPLGRRPYRTSSFEKIPGSFWGQGVSFKLRDIQSVCNAAARNLVDNMGLAAGPQGIINDINRLADGEDVTNIYPRKIWQFKDPGIAGTSKPIEFFTIDSNAGELLGIYNQFEKLADDHTGIPAFTEGTTRVPGAGRALADYEEILTPTGPVPIGDVDVGDKVLNTYGSSSTILGVFPQGESDVFRMKFSNGEHVDCDANHRWLVSDHPERDNSWKVKTTNDFIKDGLFRITKKDERNPKGYRAKWALPSVAAVEFDERDVKIDPYTMGVLLGDGDSRCRVTGHDLEIFDRIPYKLGKVDRKDDNIAFARTVKGIKKDYRSYGLNVKSIEKFIPEDYLYNSFGNRLELLRGLMDTDGCASSDGEKVFYSTSSKKLAKGFKLLVKSLGATNVCMNVIPAGTTTIMGRTHDVVEGYKIHFIMNSVDVFHLTRKKEKVQKRRPCRLYITGIEFIGKHSATCITVDAKDSLFLCANYIPTHNTSSGLAMLMNASARGIKKVIAQIDEDVVKPIVEERYERNMLYNPDESIKGDAKVQPRGVLALIIREQTAMRRLEFMNTTNNPTDLAIIGPSGRANMLRDTAEDVGFPKNSIVPSEQDIEQQEALAQQAQLQQSLQEQGGGQGQQQPQPIPAA